MNVLWFWYEPGGGGVIKLDISFDPNLLSLRYFDTLPCGQHVLITLVLCSASNCMHAVLICIKGHAIAPNSLLRKENVSVAYFPGINMV